MADTYRSKYRCWITEFFKENEDARYSAADIYQKMCEAGMKINLVTVYRNLDKLSDEKVINRQKMPGEDEYFYQYQKPDLGCADHLHLYCQRCGKIIHLNASSMRRIRQGIFMNYGFTIDCRESMLAGLCAECASLEKRREQKNRKNTESEHTFMKLGEPWKE